MSGIGGKIVRGAAVVSGLTLFAKALSFVQKQIVAYCFGTGMEADVFAVAFQSIVFGFVALSANGLKPFLPLFVEKREADGEPAAWRFAGSTAGVLLLLLAAAAAIGMAFAPFLLRLVTRYEDPNAIQLGARLVRLMLPAILFTGLFSLAGLVLNSEKKFLLPALGDGVNRAAIILVVLALYRWLGIHALALGILVGALASLLLQCPALWSRRAWFTLRIDWRDPALARLGLLVPPVLAGSLLSQCRTLADNWFASGLGEGRIASLGYARSITDTLTMVVPYALGIAIYPFFAELATRRDRTELTHALMTTLRMIAFLFLPLSAGLVLLRVPLLQLAFERGRFGADSLALTSGPLFFYGLGLCGFALEIILMTFFFALKDTKTPVLVGVIALVVHVSLVASLRGVLSHNSIALAAAVSKSLKVALLFALLRAKGLDLQLGRNLSFALRCAGAVAVMAALVLLLRHALGGALPITPGLDTWHKALRLAVLLAAGGAAGLITYAAAAHLLRMEEMRFLLRRGAAFRKDVHA